LSQSPNRQQKNRNLQSLGIVRAFAYNHLSGALLVVRNASAISPIGADIGQAADVGKCHTTVSSVVSGLLVILFAAWELMTDHDFINWWHDHHPVA
jgi:hypothetical protein